VPDQCAAQLIDDMADIPQHISKEAVRDGACRDELVSGQVTRAAETDVSSGTYKGRLTKRTGWDG
jgi:hypothetical protein